MFAVIRKLWVCMLVLALPVQATLAATQAFCAAHQRGGAAAHSMAGASAAVNTAVVVTANAHHDGCPHAASGDGGLPLGAPQNDPASAADAPCSACVLCCAPGVMPALTQRLPVAAPAPTVFGAVDAAVEAFASGGPDRPPRSVIG